MRRLLLLAFVIAAVSHASAQTAADSALATEQANADAKLKIAQDQQAMLTGMLPSSTAAPQSGAFAVTGSNPFDSQKLAYDVLSEVAGKVADKVTATGPIFIYDQNEINSLVSYQSALRILSGERAGVEHLTSTFDELHFEAEKLLRLPRRPGAPSPVRTISPLLAPGLALGGLKTVSDLIGMFRTNTNIAYSSFTADDVALNAAVVGALIAKGRTVYAPATMPLDTTGNASAFLDDLSETQAGLLKLQSDAVTDQSKVQQVSDALGAFIQADQALESNTDATKKAALTNAAETARVYALGLLGGTASDPLDAPTANIWKAQRDQFLKEFANLVTSVSAMATSLATLQTALTAVSSTGSSPLAAILRAEKLTAKISEPNAAILLVKTSVLGGSVVTKTNLFTGGKLLFTGGAIVNYTIFDAAGAVTASGLVVGKTASKRDKL